MAGAAGGAGGVDEGVVGSGFLPEAEGGDGREDELLLDFFFLSLSLLLDFSFFSFLLCYIFFFLIFEKKKKLKGLRGELG